MRLQCVKRVPAIRNGAKPVSHDPHGQHDDVDPHTRYTDTRANITPAREAASGGFQSGAGPAVDGA